MKQMHEAAVAVAAPDGCWKAVGKGKGQEEDHDSF